MASAESRSFLGSISPWSASRDSTPPPPATKLVTEDGSRREELLKQAAGLDHSISSRPSPSLKRYPRDCPPLKPRWFYAVDVPKRKPFAPETSTGVPKPASVAKKLVPFSVSDSQAIETAFQELDTTDDIHQTVNDSPVPRITKVPVNEDYLFDVVIEKRELEPAYWLGPIYEVRRGSWFYQDGSPCDENLSNQLEEGYLKVAPWRKTNLQVPRAASQSRAPPASLDPEGIVADPAASSTSTSANQFSIDARNARAGAPDSSSYRLFGAHMNSTVTYQDGAIAWLATDDFMSRMSSSVYGRFGGVGGTKILRGYADGTVAVVPKPKNSETPSDDKRKSGSVREAPGFTDKQADANMSEGVTDYASTEQGHHRTNAPSGHSGENESAPVQPRRTALERQLSSLAGLPNAECSEDLAEEARQEEEKEMEDYRGADAKEQSREVEHLVLVSHGIGQRLGLRLDSINFIHDVNTLRKTMKAVYASAPDLQALNQRNDMPTNCRVQVLPICWRHLLDFPKQNVRQNRKEADLGEAEGMDEEDYPSLADITVDGVPAVRNLITDLAMDVLLYQSAYREHIGGIVQRECNRVLKLFKERNPSFSGRVSLCGHSLGSAILFDILCRQKDTPPTSTTRSRDFDKTATEKALEEADLQLDFDCENFFCLGSPIALFQMLKGRTVAGHTEFQDLGPESPYNSNPMSNDSFQQASTHSRRSRDKSSFLPITTSSPKCSEIFNIFHPTDPIAYRIEPLISPAMAALKPQPLPYTKRGLFGAPGIANIGALVGQSVGSMWYNFTSGVASTLLNRSLGITGEEQALPGDGRLGTKLPSAATGNSVTGTSSELDASARSAMPVADGKKQQALADAARSSSTKSERHHSPTLIDSEMETLYAGFQKGQWSSSLKPTGSEPVSNSGPDGASTQAARLKREEAKVRALNSNGRVDYSVREGVFDISLLASIASHLSYWSDEDVVHFLQSQLLKKGRKADQAKLGKTQGIGAP